MDEFRRARADIAARYAKCVASLQVLRRLLDEQIDSKAAETVLTVCVYLAHIDAYYLLKDLTDRQGSVGTYALDLFALFALGALGLTDIWLVWKARYLVLDWTMDTIVLLVNLTHEKIVASILKQLGFTRRIELRWP